MTKRAPHAPILLLGAIVLSAVLGCSSSTDPYSPLIDALNDTLPDHRLRLLEPVSAWIACLGEPHRAVGADNYPTLLWWPEKGIGIAASPYFEGQRFRRKFEEWKVTSILVPLSPSISIPDLVREASFSTTLDLKVLGKKLQEWTVNDYAAKFHQIPDQPEHVLRFETEPPSARFHATEFAVYLVSDRPIAVLLTAEADLADLD